jgi:hypothetical protein
MWFLWCKLYGLTLSAGVANAQETATAHWLKLGEQAVVLGAEHATIEIGSNENRFAPSGSLRVRIVSSLLASLSSATAGNSRTLS